MSRQEPQVAPQPVRIVRSPTVVQPLLAASRIWWSVTPLQMQTYTAGAQAGGPGMACRYCTGNENGCQTRT